MRRQTILTTTAAFTVADVCCDQPPARSWSAPEEVTGHALVLPYRGVFGRETGGRHSLLDPTVAYLQRPGTQDRFTHPAGGGDVCVAIGLSPQLLASLAGGDPDLELASVPVTPGAGVALRRLATANGGGDADGAVTEGVVRLVAAVLAARLPERVASGRPPTVRARARLVDGARLALNADPTLGLTGLARLLGASPHHLSRVFHQATGVTVSAYRTRLRVGRALERLAGGEADLAALAAELGFADHAHLTRTLRAHTGSPPAALRRLLAG